jgi:hypothetical protein
VDCRPKLVRLAAAPMGGAAGEPPLRQRSQLRPESLAGRLRGLEQREGVHDRRGFERGLACGKSAWVLIAESRAFVKASEARAGAIPPRAGPIVISAATASCLPSPSGAHRGGWACRNSELSGKRSAVCPMPIPQRSHQGALRALNWACQFQQGFLPVAWCDPGFDAEASIVPIPPRLHHDLELMAHSLGPAPLSIVIPPYPGFPAVAHQSAVGGRDAFQTSRVPPALDPAKNPKFRPFVFNGFGRWPEIFRKKHPKDVDPGSDPGSLPPAARDSGARDESRSRPRKGQIGFLVPSKEDLSQTWPGQLAQESLA